MMVLSEAQLAGLEQAVRDRLVRRMAAAAYVQGAAASLDQLYPVAAEVQAFAEARDVRNEANLHTLLALRLSPLWRDPLPPLAAMFLTRDGFAEEVRVEQFRQALVQPPVTLIGLDDAIPAAPREGVR